MRHIIRYVRYTVNMEVYQLNVNEVIARNVKALRQKKKLSLDNVAKLTGVSKSMLGQIERREANPTISVLWKIAYGLKVSFTALVETTEQDITVVRAHDTVPLPEDGGKFITRPVFHFDENRRFETYHVAMEPNSRLDSLAHLPGTEETITVFTGKVRITVDEQEFTLDKGDSIRYKADVPHCYTNDEKERAELSLIIYYAEHPGGHA